MNWTLDVLYDLLPAAYRSRDTELGYPLRSLLAVIAEQAEVMESDIDRLYENWFIETCDDWVVPYIGQLLGLRTLNNVENSPSYSQRSRVGNLVGYRRRKGTPGMLEQLARDTTGWNARVVEFFDLLITTQHYNHVRPHSRQTVDLRKVNELELINTPFDRTAHTVDVRNINQQNGWHNISNIGLFLWPLQSYYIQRCTAAKANGSKDYYFSQSGLAMPLFNRPRTETDEIHLADEVNTPGMLRRLPLCLELDQRRREIALKNNEIYTKLSTIRQNIIDSTTNSFDLTSIDDLISNRSTLFDRLLQELRTLKKNYTPENPQSALALLHKVMIAVSDIKADYFGVQPVFQIFVNKNNTKFYFELLPEEILICNSKAGWPTIPTEIEINMSAFKNLVAVDPVLGKLTFPNPNSDTINDVLVSYAYGFSGDLGGGPYSRRESVAKVLEPDGLPRLDVKWEARVGKSFTNANGKFNKISNALEDWSANGEGKTGILAITDNQTYEEDLNIKLPPGSLLVIVSTDWAELNVSGMTSSIVDSSSRQVKLSSSERRAHIKGKVIAQSGDSSNMGGLVINGLLIEGTLDIMDVSLMRIAHTVITQSCEIKCKDEIHVERSVMEDLNVNIPSTKININESIFNSTVNTVYSELIVDRSTFLANVSAQVLNASNSIFMRNVAVTQKQSSFVRFSYIKSDFIKSLHHFRCQPSQALSQSGQSEKSAILSRIVPRFASTTLFTPNYCQLSVNCAEEIRTGAEDGSEMGAFSFLKIPQREANIKASLDEFLPLGLNAGVLSAILE